MSKTYNVLIVHNEYQYAGGEDVVVKQDAQLLEKKGNQVSFYLRNNEELKHYNIFQKLLLPFTTVFSLKSYREIRRLIREKHIEIVHVHNTLPLISFSCYYAAKREKVKLIQTIHNFRMVCPNALFFREHHICEECMEKGLLQSVKYGCYRNSKVQTLVVVMSMVFHRIWKTYDLPDAYIALTQFNKEKISSIVNSQKIFVKPNYVNVVLPGKRIIEEEPYTYYVYAARLERVKGIFVLLEAFKALPNCKLFVLGTGPDEEEVKNFIERNQMNHVICKGFVPHEETLAYICQARAVIYPSLWYEGFPMTIVESFACGTPVIASDTPNLQEKIRHDETGEVFATGNPKTLCETIKRLEKNEFEKYMQLRKSVRECYDTEYTETVVYEKMMKIYQ